MSSKRTSWIVWAVAALLAAVPIAASAGFVASPMELFYDMAAGVEGTRTLTITNRADLPLTVRLYLVDSRFGSDGTEENLEPGTLERSCAPWVVLAENVIDLESRETRAVPVTLAVPGEARGSYWTKLFLEETSSPQATQAVHEDRTYNIFMRQRIGVRIFQDVPGTERPDVAITNVEIRERNGEEPLGILVDVANAGNTVARCTGEVELRDESGAIAEKIPLGTRGQFVVFPDGERRIAVHPPESLSSGTYTALAIVDFGGDHLVAGDTLLEIRAQPVVYDDGSRGP
jgi:hypothetical protein